MSLKYYEEERARYAAEGATAITLEDARALIASICQDLGIPVVSFSINNRLKACSLFRVKGARQALEGFIITPRGNKATNPRIEMSKDMMYVRVVLHELAHYVHTMDFDRRYHNDQLRACRHTERWHGDEHRHFMRILINKYRASINPKIDMQQAAGC